MPPESGTQQARAWPTFDVAVDPDAPLGDVLPALARLLLERARRRLAPSVERLPETVPAAPV
jgi:hypothetical protein